MNFLVSFYSAYKVNVGFDLIVEEKGQGYKVWLIEGPKIFLKKENLLKCILSVNASPSMGYETALDEKIKIPLIKDTITLVNPVPFSIPHFVEILKNRLKTQRLFSNSTDEVKVYNLIYDY